MAIKSKNPLEQILFRKGKINEKQLSQIETAKKRGENVEDFIISKKIATEEDIAEVISEEIGVPFLDLRNFIIDPEVLRAIDEKRARHLVALPLYKVRDTLTIAMANPRDINAIDEIKLKTKDIQIVMSTKSAILEAIGQNYMLGNTLEDIINPIKAKGIVYAPESSMPPHMLASLAEGPPVIKFVNQMIFDALQSRASDIHIDPVQDKLRIRFRIDGILRDVVTIPKKIHLPIIPRIKILATLDIAESRRPQDGRFSVGVSGRQVDLRVGIFPMSYGESVSIRLLDRATSLLSIEDLGFSTNMCKTFKRLITRNHGIILVAGATGSGKTSTLYAALNKLSSPEKNILTIEDPIEYLLDNINQAQVNPKIGVNFASAIRSFMRQDPDVIMVGEIRDNETAEMALRAALTGHLVFSTLHTNDAPTAIPRLEDLGLDKNSLASSIICVLAQRLIRIICPSCKKKDPSAKRVFKDLNIELDPNIELYKGTGCNDCRDTGYKGRIGLFELLEVTDAMRTLIQKDVPIEEMKKFAVRQGMKTFKEDALDKVKKGITTLEEVIRVIQD